MLSQRSREKNAWFLEAFKRPLRRQGSSNPSNIDLATAENWLIRPEMLPLLKKNCKKNLKEKHLSYANGLGGTPELLAAASTFFNHFFSPVIPVKPEHIVTGTGLSAVLDTLMNDICDEGDGLLVTAPFWGSFQVSAVLRNSVKLIPVFVPFHESNSIESVVAAYRTAAEEADCKVRGILFCNPHNPYGHICPAEVLDGLLKYCEEANLHFVSDEIYALSAFGAVDENVTGRGEGLESPATEFVSVLSRDLKELGVSGSRVHLLYSISKDLGCSGIRLGCLVTQSNKDLRMSQAILNNAKLCNAASVMVTPILQDIPTVTALVDLNIRKLRRAAMIAIRFAEFHGLTYYKPAAGLYIWLRLSKDCETAEEEESLVQRCAENGALVGSGSDYAEPHAGWFRLTFALPEADFLEGLRRIEDTIGYKERFQWKKKRWGSVFKKRWQTLCF
ncbi:Aminotransferase verI [Cladobotryum mycophilum]|uniref:Aminotransferase verI n=1 Tax=Cladobotryum mycophilum TaxID=491253 RepID=A0ABR0S8R0_9HYPO